MSKPTLVLVHGSWHSPLHYDGLIKDLETHGYKVVPVSLPSTQSPGLPPASLTDDTSAVRIAVLSGLDAGNNVVVIAHSYGGTPANNALKGLEVNSRKADSASTAVTAIASLCAIPTPAGSTFRDNLGGQPAPIHDLSRDANFCLCRRTRPALLLQRRAGGRGAEVDRHVASAVMARLCGEDEPRRVQRHPELVSALHQGSGDAP